MTTDICVLQNIKGQEEQGLTDVDSFTVPQNWKTGVGQNWVVLIQDREGRPDSQWFEAFTAVGSRCFLKFPWDIYELSLEIIFLPL